MRVSTSMIMSFNKLVVVLSVVMTLSGCARMGPATITEDRIQYRESLARSQQSQNLLNIVKLRYLEWPVFLDVQQIVAGYNWEHSGRAAHTNIFQNIVGAGDSGTVEYSGKFVERPTITYSQLSGEKFYKSMLQPADVRVFLALIQAGWPASQLFKVLVDQVNGKHNRGVSYKKTIQEDPAFLKFYTLLKKLQMQNALDIVITGKENKKTVIMNFRTQSMNEQTRRELDEVKMLLGLKPELNRFNVKWGPVSDAPDTIAIKTRSIVKVMLTLSAFVEVPEEDIKHGNAVVFEQSGEDVLHVHKPLITIHSGKTVPENAYVTTQYRNYWFWIADNDPASKRTFSFLSLMMAASETGEKAAPQLTISTD